ncbi:MAG: sensor histidine kinase [Pseudomonadota bacterium]|nr:MAG: sensor histidine kinase [Pseudomonadota bacterium]
MAKLPTINLNEDAPGCEDLFLPNFCGIRMVSAVVLIAQLFAFVLTLAPLGPNTADRWSDLGMISVFVQWNALTSCALLCLVRPLLCRLKTAWVVVITLAILLGIIALMSEGTFWLLHRSFAGFVPIPVGHWEFLWRNLAIGGIVSALVLRYFYVQHQWKRNTRTEAEARLQALQSRIRPHFLFNSMNTIASLTRSQPEQAELAVEDLADLFRASLRDARNRITLEEELELCRRYLHIEGLRLGERLHVAWRTETLPGDALIPPLTLQPLVENAIYHGIERQVEGGTVTIAGRMDGRRLQIDITNPSPGADATAHREGNRLAMDNIRERLAMYYGPRDSVQVEDNATHYRVSINIPYHTESDEDPYR